MNPPSVPVARFMLNRRRLYRRLFLLTFAVLTSPLVRATAPVSPPPTTSVSPAGMSDRVVELSPFVITADTETGWVAAETLAGSRLRTNFKDVPNQIETLTKEFMTDLAINTLEEGLSYSANAENGSDYLANQLKPNNSSRLRGIGTGTMTRNFFQVRNPTDNFNLERATVASGPNAILFGLGSPAGILDATTARARMRKKYAFEVQYDSVDSKRATFDVNRVIAPGMVALRLMGLSKRELTAKKPNLDRDERLYGTLTFTPFKTTTLTLDWERAHRNINRASRRAPNDFVTLWLNADKIAGSGYAAPRPIYNNNNLATIATNRIFSQAPDAPLFISGGGPVPLQNWRNSVFAKNPVTQPGVDPVFDAAINHTLLDPALFPFDVNLLGTARTTLLGANTKTGVLEQKLASNLFLEVAYNYEKSYDHRISSANYGNAVDVDLNIDANQFLPGSTTPNPNVGKYFVQGGTASSLEFYRRDDVRATLSYEQDLARKFSGWGRHLGRHRLLGLYTESQAEYRGQQNFQRRILEEPAIPGVVLRARTFQNWATHASRVMQFRQYLDNPYTTVGSPGSMTGDWTMMDANGRPFSLYLFDTPLRAADGKRLGGGQVPEGTRDRNSGQVLAWQGFFLPDREKQDRLVLTYGYRKDRARNAGLDAASVQQDFSGLFPLVWDTKFTPFGEAQSGINRNIGAVVRPLKWLTLFYNRSSTFEINLGTYDPFGNAIPGAGGKGIDRGVRIDLWRDRLSLRVNRYENTLSPQRIAGPLNPFRDIFFNLENRVLTLDPGAPTINVTDGNKRGFRVAGRPSYQIVGDLESSGYEVELNFSPTRNWNLRVNGAKSEAVESNIGQPWFAWTEARLPVWTGVVAKNGERDAQGQPVTWKTALLTPTAANSMTLEQYFNSTLVGNAFAFMQASDGKVTGNGRSARANLITNYRFTSGRLGGFNAGGAVRWRAAPNIGYGTKRSASGNTVLDIDRPYNGREELFCDAMLGYRGRFKAFSNLNYRVQLNVRNVLNRDDPVPVAAMTTGAVVRLATVEPRAFVFTFGVEF